MTYSLDIYLTDSTKTRGLGWDSMGQDLSWTNEVAVCDDIASCDETTFAANTPHKGVQPPYPTWCRHHVDPRCW